MFESSWTEKCREKLQTTPWGIYYSTYSREAINQTAEQAIRALSLVPAVIRLDLDGERAITHELKVIGQVGSRT